MGMTKLMYSADFDPVVGVGAELITRQGELTKQASTIFGMEYSDMKPDDRHVGIHVVALGDEEHYGCFFAGAPVSTIKGQKPIEDIVDGDEVLTHRGNYKKVLKTFTSLYSGTKVTVSVLGLPHGIECTEEHPFLVVRRDGLSPASRWKLRNAGELQNVLEARAKSADFVKASELEPGMFLVIPTRPSDEELSRYDNIPEEFDPYVAGFYLAEGCLVKEYKEIRTKGEYNGVLLSGSVKDDNVFSYVDGWLAGIGRVVPKRQRSLTSEYGVRYGFGFKAFAGWLDTVFGHDAAEKHLHPQLYKWSDDKLMDFLAGYFDGDGCLHTSKNRYEGTLVASTASRTLVMDLQRMLSSLGIASSVNQSWNKASNGCFGHGDLPIYSICVGSFYSNRILSRCLRLRPHGRVLKASGASSLQYAKHYALLPISDVQFESVDNVQKYNFEVEEDNSYVVDVAVHNCNRNADSFDKKACIKYHDTFVKYGHVFRHHRNKDPEKSIGTIKAAAYNESMGRVELFIHADKEKAAPEIERLEKEGEIPLSMACRVPFDVCSCCGAMRKHAGDASECEHVRDHLGEMSDDGKIVFTRNTEPQFFDISFVGRPADRIAWNLKVASALPLSSVKEAEYEHIKVPDELACDTESSRRKLGYAKDIAEMQRQYRGWLSKQASVVTARDGYLYELRRVPMSSLDDDAVSQLRELPTKMAFAVLADAGVVMDVPTFFKYATGDDYDAVVRPYMRDTAAAVPSLIEDRVNSGSAASLCTNTDFDAEGYEPRVKASLYASLKRASCMDGIPETAVERAGVDDVLGAGLDTDRKIVCNTGVVEKLAETYASYQLSAIDAVLTRRSGENRSKMDVEAVAASGNVTR